MLFTQGGHGNRYVSFARISPGRLQAFKHGGAEFIGIKTLDGSTPKVACGLHFGCVEWSNIISGELPDDSSSRRKKAIHVGQIGGWCAREQSCITKAFGMSASDPNLIAQLGDDYVEFSTKLQPAGMYISSPLLTYSDDVLL